MENLTFKAPKCCNVTVGEYSLELWKEGYFHNYFQNLPWHPCGTEVQEMVSFFSLFVVVVFSADRTEVVNRFSQRCLFNNVAQAGGELSPPGNAVRLFDGLVFCGSQTNWIQWIRKLTRQTSHRCLFVCKLRVTIKLFAESPNAVSYLFSICVPD